MVLLASGGWSAPRESTRSAPSSRLRGAQGPCQCRGRLRPLGTRPTLRWRLYPRTLRSDDIVKTLPSGKHPCVVVLDNAGIHTSKAVQRALPALSRVGLSLFYLPAYSPQLNEVEPVFGVIKGHEMPERSYATLSALMAAVRRAFRHQITSRR
ncbi:hypothetical protein STIAU_5625 [Stigmatella aurantiaca DW4/3-1]|uniref:Tc1-like transposase DDE domain-containing protein n=1 Tax=Stigmatella aurantiaca (strain DW4/3-1) TaxID=378806 RepID=Q09DQ0_STIAD|nr:hypothetical protein STIAU_5625 [Stigmatella aurantiaca DW4/3-1]